VGADAPAFWGVSAVKIAVNVVFAVWLLVGAVAAGQRHYFAQPPSCDVASTVAVTMVAGPLNYDGLDPRVSCPQPS